MNRKSESSLYAPAPRPLPADLLLLEVACNSGAGSRLAGFKVTSNMYMKNCRSLPGEQMKAWAWDLGWREADAIAQQGGAA